MGLICCLPLHACEIWETGQQTYSKVRDVTQIYEIKTKITTTKQGILYVIEYYNIMKGLWLELDYYQNFKMKCREDATLLQLFVEHERIFYFFC